MNWLIKNSFQYSGIKQSTNTCMKFNFSGYAEVLRRDDYSIVLSFIRKASKWGNGKLSFISMGGFPQYSARCLQQISNGGVLWTG